MISKIIIRIKFDLNIIIFVIGQSDSVCTAAQTDLIELPLQFISINRELHNCRLFICRNNCIQHFSSLLHNVKFIIYFTDLSAYSSNDRYADCVTCHSI